MATPTTSTSNMAAPLVYSNGFRLTYSVGNGDRRLVSVSVGGSVSYPVDGVKYDGNLKFGNGDALVLGVYGSGSCYPYPPPYPDPIESTDSTGSGETIFTSVVYEGMSDGITGLDIVNLKQQTSYQIMVFEHNNYCYATSSILTITTAFKPNMRSMNFAVKDNLTKLPIGSASIAIKDRNGFISETGSTDEKGIFNTQNLEEGRYEASIVSNGYDSKELAGLFIQREEPTRDNEYRMFTSAGNTAYGTTVNREQYINKNEYIVYLDPLGTKARSYTVYTPDRNPSKLTKL